MRNLYMKHGASEGTSLPVVASTKSGDPVRVGKLNGVAATDRGAGRHARPHASVVTAPDDYLYEVAGAIAGPGTPVFITARAGATAPILTTVDPGGGAVPWGHTVPKVDETGVRAGTSGVAVVRPAKV